MWQCPNVFPSAFKVFGCCAGVLIKKKHYCNWSADRPRMNRSADTRVAGAICVRDLFGDIHPLPVTLLRKMPLSVLILVNYIRTVFFIIWMDSRNYDNHKIYLNEFCWEFRWEFLAFILNRNVLANFMAGMNTQVQPWLPLVRFYLTLSFLFIYFSKHCIIQFNV